MNNDMTMTGFSILIVDDEKSNIRILHHILQQSYTIYTAKDGETAINIAREYRPDLILLDVIMPGMNGYEVLSELKGYDDTRDIPVIFVTGLSNADDEVKGFLLGAADYITKPFNSTIVKVRIKQQLQTVKQIRTIKRLGMIDPLTDLPNRRSFDSQMKFEWGRAIREKIYLSMLMIDLDKFKIYNDTYGHPQGDVLLQSVAEIFHQTVKRSTDFVARWGGEEFAVLLPNTNIEGAAIVAENIRANTENAVVLCADGTSTGTRISIGISSKLPDMTTQISELVTGADKALYEAKKQGGNRVCTIAHIGTQ